MGAAKELFIESEDAVTMDVIVNNTYTERDVFISELIKRVKSGEEKLSYSSISQFKKSPRSFIDYKMGKKEQTDAMKLGSLVHCLILTPQLFESKYFVFDDTEKVTEIGGGNPRATNAYKKWKTEQLALVGDKDPISKTEFDQASLMANSVLNNSASKPILEKCPNRETPMSFEMNGLNIICFLDAHGNECILDIKICADADPRKFQKTILYDGYYLQGGVYELAVGELKPYYIVAVDRTGAVSVHLLMDSLLEHGMTEFERLTREFVACVDNNDFHQSYEYRTHNGYYQLDKPPYAF